MSSVTDMTRGKPLQLILRFTLPLFVGNLFQQLYNVVDSIVVGRFVSKDALAAVGASFSLMNFITAILIGICMGCGVVFAQYYGAGDIPRLKRAVSTALLFAGGLTVVLTTLSLAFAGPLLRLIQIPEEIFEMTRGYILIIFGGLPFVFLYNAGAFLLRSLGNSKVPLYFLILSTALNIVLDLLFVVGFGMGVQGAALATVAAQAVSSVCCILYCLKKLTLLRYAKGEFCFDRAIFGKIASYGVLTSVQQSIMNLGILAVQGIVNTFGTNVIAAFTVAVKIEAFAYLPVQDFGNAFSTYVAQNKGGGRMDRIRQGTRVCIGTILCACFVISLAVVIFARPLMGIFLSPEEGAVIATGVGYLRVVAPFYALIGFLFMHYGFYRGLGDLPMSILLTVISLGLRVALAAALSIPFGPAGIWWSIPIGWLCADLVGFAKMGRSLRGPAGEDLPKKAG